MSVQTRSENFILLMMYTSFTFEVRLTNLSEKAWAAIINNLDVLGFALTGFMVGGQRYENTHDQEKRLVLPAIIIEKLTQFLLRYPAPDQVFTLLTAYQDTTIFMHWSRAHEDVLLTWSFNNGDEYHDGDVWKKYFTIAEESLTQRLYAEDDDYFYDNARYARLLLDVLEPVAIKSFNLHGRHFQLHEPLPADRLIAVIGDPRYYNFSQDFTYQILNNILLNRFFFTLSPSDEVLPSVDEAEQSLQQQLEGHGNAVLYIKREHLIAKLIVDTNKNHVILVPQEPYVGKTYATDYAINRQFYVRLLIGLCEHYPIWQLKSDAGLI